jgi:subtilisin family serine protease
MATPHVAGLAGLVWSVVPSLTPDQVGQMMRDTAQDLGTPGWDQYFGYGRIDALSTLQALQPFLVNLQETNKTNLVAPISFLIDDANIPAPSSRTIQVITANPETIFWTATISPPVPWLNIIPPGSGSISASSSNQLTLVASKPATYGTYSTNLVVSGTTSGGANVGNKTVQVKINYIPELNRIRLPFIFKD